jgi:antitoxin component HigA of HigAB toxin-antitoxin module
MKDIKTENQYKKAMSEILTLMNKGEGNLTAKETIRLRKMALAVQAYEKLTYAIHT